MSLMIKHQFENCWTTQPENPLVVLLNSHYLFCCCSYIRELRKGSPGHRLCVSVHCSVWCVSTGVFQADGLLSSSTQTFQTREASLQSGSLPSTLLKGFYQKNLSGGLLLKAECVYFFLPCTYEWPLCATLSVPAELKWVCSFSLYWKWEVSSLFLLLKRLKLSATCLWEED